MCELNIINKMSNPQDSQRRKTRSHSPCQRHPINTTAPNTPNNTGLKNGKASHEVEVAPFIDEESIEESDSWYRDSSEVVKENARIKMDEADKMWRGAMEVVKAGNISFVSSKRGIYAFKLVSELNRVLCQVNLQDKIFAELPPFENYKAQTQLISKVLELEKQNRNLNSKINLFDQQINTMKEQLATTKTKKEKFKVRPLFGFKIYKNQKEEKQVKNRSVQQQPAPLRLLNDSRNEEMNKLSVSRLQCLSILKTPNIMIQPIPQKPIEVPKTKKNLQIISFQGQNTVNFKIQRRPQNICSKMIEFTFNNQQKPKLLNSIGNEVSKCVHVLHNGSNQEKKQILIRDFGRIAKSFVELINVFWQTMKRHDFRKSKGQLAEVLTQTKDFASWFNTNKDFCQSGTKTLDEQFTTQTVIKIENVLCSVQRLMS